MTLFRMRPSERKIRITSVSAQVYALEQELKSLRDGCGHVLDDYTSAAEGDTPSYGEVSCSICQKRL